jgi:hypothetical protein
MPSRITGSGNITLGALEIGEARPPHTYLGVADSLTSTLTLVAAQPEPSAIAFCLLAAHQAECLLKAFLSRDGSDAKLKAPGLRHNLEALWLTAHSEGLELATPPPSWLLRLSQLHDNPYQLRYSTGVHGIVTPPVEEVAAGLRELSRVVKAAI